MEIILLTSCLLYWEKEQFRVKVNNSVTQEGVHSYSIHVTITAVSPVTEVFAYEPLEPLSVHISKNQVLVYGRPRRSPLFLKVRSTYVKYS